MHFFADALRFHDKEKLLCTIHTSLLIAAVMSETLKVLSLTIDSLIYHHSVFPNVFIDFSYC